MFQFARLPPPALFDSGRGTRALPRVGFPIRIPRDQRMVSSFPGLFAAAHVLHRLLAPRHPPCALRLLIVKNTMFAAMEFSRCTRACPPHEKPPRGRSLTTQQRATLEVDVRSRRARAPDDYRPMPTEVVYRDCGHRQSRAPAGVRAPASLERR